MHASASPAIGLIIAPTVTLDGADLPALADEHLMEVEVETSLHLPGMAVLTFEDDSETTVLKASRAKVGSILEIKSVGREGTTETPLIKAEITSIEGEFGHEGVRTVVRAYEKSHRLHLGKKTKTFQNVKDSDIASQIAQGAGLTAGTVTMTSATHTFVSQVDETDWEFLAGRARAIGYEFGVTDDKFYFRPPVKASTGPATDTPAPDPPAALELEYAENLLALDVRVTGSGQAPDVQVRSWDPVQKIALKSTASSATTEASVQDTPSALAGKVGGKTVVETSMAYATQAEVDEAAKGLAADVGSTFVECEGTALGEAKMTAGVAVRITNVGAAFKGQYTLTRVRHSFTEDGYLTHFEMSGRRDRSLLGLITGGVSRRAAAPSLGVATGLVTQNDDPDKVGKVKIKLPWLDDTFESDWVRVAQMGAGPNSGAVWLPEVDDEVLVAFEFGDPARPYVLSSLWNGKDKPMLGDGLVDNGKMKRRGFVSRKGHKLVFFDGDDKSGIGMVSSDGKLKVSLNETNGEVKIHSSGKVTIITESGGDVALTSAGKLDVQTTGDASIKADGKVTINGSGGVTVQSSGQVQISGSMIQLG